MTDTTTKRANVMRKVQGLLDKAASTTFDAERDSLIAKADALMGAWAIEEFELESSRPTRERTKPELRTVPIVGTNVPYDVRVVLLRLFGSLASHVGVKVGSWGYHDPEDRSMYVAKCVGWPADLDYLHRLFVSLQLHLVSRIEPKPVAGDDDVTNFARLRDSGMDYKRIFQLMDWEWTTKPGGTGHGDLTGWSNTQLRKMRKAYTALCAEQGRKPVKGLKADTYRKSFIDGYVAGIESRLREMKVAREEATAGKGLVLANRLDLLVEFFYETFPNLRPHPETCECETCHFMKCYDDSCDRPRCVEWRKSNASASRRAPKIREEKVDHDAYSRGRETAATADLDGAKVGASAPEALGR